MKHKMWSRLLSMMLAVMMIASIVPNSAFAEAASEIAASSQAAVEVVEETEEVTLPEEEVPASEAPAEETPAVEPTAEPAPTEEPVAEPTQAPAETVAPSEDPSAEPTAAPEGTETPEGTAVPSETPAASTTPAPSESPVPSETPAPSEEPAIDGQALLDELMAIEDDEAFMKAVNELTEEQTAALEALGEEALAEYTLRVETLTAPEETPISELRGEELAEKLMELSDEEFMAQIGQLTQEQIDSLMVLDEALLGELDNRFSQLNPDQGTGTVAAPFTSVGPIAASPSFMMNKSPALFSLNGNSYVNPIDGLIVDKNVTTYDEANEIFKIELSAEAESNIVETSIPCDIILVLDRSGSMRNGSRANDLIIAAENFVGKIYQNSPKSRVAVVGYAGSGWLGNDPWAKIYSGDETFGGAFVPVENIDDLTDDIRNSMKNPDGGTYSNKGLEYAWEIFNAVEPSDPCYDNSRAVVMFTDGVPGSGSWGDGRTKESAQSAIYWGQVLKQAKGTTISVDASDGFYGSAGTDFVEDGQLQENRKDMAGSGAVIYTIGLGLPSDDTVKHDWLGRPKENDCLMVNEYMYRLSSNRPDGTHVDGWEWKNGTGYTNIKTRNLKEGYYLTTDNSSELDKIFQQIADQTGKPIENAIIRDYISPYFQLVDQNGNPIEVGGTVQSGKYSGVVREDSNGIYVEWTNVTLKPMEPGKPETEEKFSGTLYIKPKAEFMGGTNVPTNIYGISGVYSNDECIGSFKECVANVRVKNEYNVQDQSIYITNNANISSMIVGNENGPRPFVSFGGGAYSNDFVETVYTVKGSDGESVGTWTFEKGENGVWEGKAISPDECSQYTVSCTVENTSIPSMDKNEKAWVHVFTPTVTWKDSSQDYNTVLSGELLKGHAVKTEWSDKHNAEISGTAPDISFEFADNIVDQPIQQNLDVKVSKVLIAGQDKTERVSFAWEKGADCPGECTAAPENAQFRIHLKTGDLTITKTLKGDATAAKQETFLFQITGAGKTYYASVVLGAGKNSGDTVVKNLPAGSYTVEEILCPKGYALESSNPDNGTVFVSGADALIEFVNTVTTNPDDPTKDDSMAINRFSKDQNGEWTWDWANKPSDSSQ